ncbi:Integrin alpha-4 CD49 antigen-like family member D [Collichthys lucidus]|uniref:Integrin alpha-4 CD49 antigen-like family member D n=1 Tax=Collichthys lucidus TaxID=240159 RepID=A0A4U5U1C0_COLLU|nr:Integrin alpha-4 CD49 antigen-like family member D [Collichthys lucidus]
MFGYSVLLHRHGAHKWLVVGAPVAKSPHSLSAQSPGAIYRCNITAEHRHCHRMHSEVQTCGKTCESDSDQQWLGVSLSRQPGDNGGHILACAHRWKNVFYSNKDSQNHKLPNGLCYRYSNDLSHTQPMIPCYRDYQWKFGVDYGSCQAGISNFLTEDLVIMGAPGTSYWTGSVLVFNTSSRGMSLYLDDEAGAVGFESYLGYSVGAGHFLSPDSLEVVGGAPRYKKKGKVFIFTVDNNMLRAVSEVSGKELGSYFGSSVCAVDLNNDGLSDLLVGAPMATGVTREEGRVYVYINQGQAELLEAQFELTGSDAYAARFGETIANLGDLDDDGYPDVAIGAPQEDDLKGAVYIYNGRKEGISPTPSQRITGSTLGRDLRMFGQSLSSSIDIDDNGYQDVAVGAFLSDSAVVLRSRPVIQVKASLTLPEQIDPQLALCQGHKNPTVCFNITVCFSVRSRHFRGAIELQYNLTSDLLHKPSFPHRFYFHGNGSSNSTRGRVKARHGQLTCTTHLAYQRKDVRDIFTPVQFEVSYSHRETTPHRHASKTFPPLKPILQQSAGHTNTITNQTWFARRCSLPSCSTNMELSAKLVLPNQQQYFPLGSGQTIMLKTVLLNSGDDAFLPRLTLRFPNNIYYIKVLNNEDNMVSCDVLQEANSTMEGVDCGVSSHLLPAHAQLNISFLLDVSQNSTPGDIMIHVNTSSDNYEREEYLHDNAVSFTLPLKYGVNINIHGFVNPTSFVFGDEDSIPVDCYRERFNYTYKVLNYGPSSSLDTVVEIMLPKILAPHQHRLLQVIEWQTSRGVCSISDTIPVKEDCDVPQASFIKQLVFFFSSTSTRRMFCGGDELCERLVCQLGNLEVGKESTIQLEIGLNPAVLLQAPGRHGIMRMESIAMMSNPQGPNTVLIHGQPVAQVVVEALFTQKPSTVVKVFIIVISLAVGLLILAALIWCLWKAGFFKRDFQKKKEESRRDSWDYVPKYDKRESTT